ncbi:hypothetical protein [Geoalkalibacter halelectricus]|uniref:Uncharacterized protein n=1 Tax=Geoalkalibacter halelectricus TaxID=2847045 RepID=A0ABY5ZKB4_9BACT|nr:hypothetical protein [Geoalkalibacter halelectricus]MDO3376630.1 hypothetical protein [Geoalkalibacter halelectricus]UWZ78412.1 hypothetical protein L9S41_12030 [Geoalkalibacter halelectricus]
MRKLKDAGAFLPFTGGDATAGSESELQVAVCGRREEVDLPLVIAQSNYYANIMRRVRAGDASPRLVSRLERFLADNAEGVWENSWVRFPHRSLSTLAADVLAEDLRADKASPQTGLRADAARFFLEHRGEPWVRVPVSYLLKLALADALDNLPAGASSLRAIGLGLLGHFLNDNTSPETFSFHVSSLRQAGNPGHPVARETAQRFLLTQLLIAYANQRFELKKNGQCAQVYFAPHPPVRQKELNDIISDSFYRELFMSPCLSGWDQGEKKHGYMHLCHQVLSRSQLTAVAKLREAGIISNNLVVLRGVSNISLANNGTHVSLGSRILSAWQRQNIPGFGRAEEKAVGDLVIKIFEHFLPLFVGTYSAAPYRLGFADFHPEKALGFLPHELHETHLRKLWRRWRKKASLQLFGHSLTPFGPPWLDRGLSALCGLRGDWVPDFRIIDYPAALLSTERSPALDGRLDNQARLKHDLSDMGVFDAQMGLYLPCRQREFLAMGYSGFEARHYSLFERFDEDLAAAVNLQLLITALAFKLIADGTVTHRHIPDTPLVESERRQIFFAKAMGIPTVFIIRTTRNRFLRRVISLADHTRTSRRYPGYLRLPVADYQRALIRLLRLEGADLIEDFGLSFCLEELEGRIEQAGTRSAAGRLTHGILDGLGARDPLEVRARDFNLAAEQYYRESLRVAHLHEGFHWFCEDLSALERVAEQGAEPWRGLLRALLPQESQAKAILPLVQPLAEETLSAEILALLIHLVVATIGRDQELAAVHLEEPDLSHVICSPIHRAL